MEKLRKTALMVSCLLSAVTFSGYAQSTHYSLQKVDLEGLHQIEDNGVNLAVLQFGGTHTQARQLAKSLPSGQVIGVNARKGFDTLDQSERNLHFETLKTLSLQSINRFDQLLVEDALTEQTKQLTLLKDLSAKLKPSGKIRMLLPDYKKGKLSNALTKTWITLQDQVTSSPSYLIYNPDVYETMLQKVGVKVDRSETFLAQKEFKTLSDFRNWLQNEWRYFQGVSKLDQSLFLQVFVGNYLEETEQLPVGPIVWEEPILKIEATKLA